MHSIPAVAMRTVKAVVPGVLALVLGACASNPSISEVGVCTLLQRPGYAANFAVQSASIRWINVLHEFPASRFMDVSFSLPESLTHAGVLALSLELSGRTAAPIWKCIPTSSSRRACTLSTPQLSEAGFVVIAVAGPGENEVALRERTSNYWNTIAACPHNAT